MRKKENEGKEKNENKRKIRTESRRGRLLIFQSTDPAGSHLPRGIEVAPFFYLFFPGSHAPGGIEVRARVAEERAPSLQVTSLVKVRDKRVKVRDKSSESSLPFPFFF